MARTKEFDRDTVVGRAIEVFWSKGFEATSIQDLVDAMGINRGSIYDTFGDKAGLFDEAVAQYIAQTPARHLVENAKTGDPRKEIEKFFDTVVKTGSAEGGQRGCLWTNTLTELCSRNDRLATKMNDGLRRIEDAFCILIRRGQACGEFPPTRRPRTLARFFVATLQGIQAMSKIRPGRRALRDIADTAVSLLD